MSKATEKTPVDECESAEIFYRSKLRKTIKDITAVAMNLGLVE